jgi:hypothetical protein
MLGRGAHVGKRGRSYYRRIRERRAFLAPIYRHEAQPTELRVVATKSAVGHGKLRLAAIDGKVEGTFATASSPASRTELGGSATSASYRACRLSPVSIRAAAVKSRAFAQRDFDMLTNSRDIKRRTPAPAARSLMELKNDAAVVDEMRHLMVTLIRLDPRRLQAA